MKIIISVFHKISLHQQLQDSEENDIKQLAERIDPQIIQLHYEISLNALSKFHVHPHPKQALELCILRMLAFQPLSESSAPQIEKKNLKLSSESKLLKKNIVKSDVPPQDGQKSRDAITIAAASEELSAENTAMLKDLDMQSWNSIFNSLNLSMFVSQVFSQARSGVPWISDELVPRSRRPSGCTSRSKNKNRRLRQCSNKTGQILNEHVSN
mgnify:CR=1 FL=1